MKTAVKSDIAAMVVYMYSGLGAVPSPRMLVAMYGPIAKPMNRAELSIPIAVPFLPDLPPRRLAGIPA